MHVIHGTAQPCRMSKRKGEPKVEVGSVGAPPDEFDELQTSIWYEIGRSAHWLAEQDRPALETFCRLKAMERTAFAAMTGAQLGALIRVNGLLGLNPSDRTRIKHEPENAPSDDDAFFGAANSA